MKRPQPDLKEIMLNSFIRNVGSVRKFKKLWGTTVVNGVEVFKEREYYFPDDKRSEKFEKLYKFLGIYNDVTEADTKGIGSAWTYLNKNKKTVIEGELEEFVTDNLNKMWWNEEEGPIPQNLTLTTDIVIEAKTISSRIGGVNLNIANTSELLDPSMSKEDLIEVIENNYETLWEECIISHEGIGVINKGSIEVAPNTTVIDKDDLSPDDPWLQTVARYALRDNGIPCTIKNVQLGYGSNEVNRKYTTYVVTLEIPYNFFNKQSLFVSEIVKDINEEYKSKNRLKLSYPNGYYTKQAITKMDSSDLEDDSNIVIRDYTLWENQSSEIDALYSNLWIKSGKTWYLKVEPFNDPKKYGLNYKKLNSYIVQLLDTGYKKKKVSWWKKAIAVVVFVISVVLALPSGGASITVAAAAYAVVVGSLVLTLFTLAFAITGNHEMASAFSSVSKFIEPLTFVASVVLLVGTFNKAVQQSVEEATKAIVAETGKEATEITTTEILREIVSNTAEGMVQGIVDSITKGASDVFAGKITNASIAFTNQLVKIGTMPSRLKFESLSEKNKDLKAEYEDLQKELNQENDILNNFMYIYAKPATADWSIYAQEFDMPYERGGGFLSLGNVQRTTKQAIRRGDYSDPAFDNILII